MTQTPIAEPQRPGFPTLRIGPAGAAVEPVTFEIMRGDDSSPSASALRLALLDVRLEVFVVEQAVTFAQEIDARDYVATTIHVLARGADGVPLGAGRILISPEHPGEVHLGRLAVRRVARGAGLGARLVGALEAAALEHAGAALDADAARAAGVAPGTPGVTVILSAQEQAMGFYERCGYHVLTGESYLDAGIPHQDMVRTLTVPQAQDAPTDPG